ncbi:MAG: TonB-dependent siderophore receptor [Goleter apudmare HA4340-LM2]|jgi:iron complex outermembrane receptor protein|nr:TonB-dependent siderophore receptor [Goleter apudmare HA4340-LM2]
MKLWQVWVLMSLLGCLSAVAIQPVKAQENKEGRKVNISSINEEEKTSLQNAAKIPQLSEIELPNTSARMLVQSPAPTNPPAQESVIQVTGVEAKPTDKGVEVILKTTDGDKLQITNRSAENNFIADIPNAQLRLPNGDGFTFRSEKPSQGITEITVTNLDANTIRVTVIGEKALPTVELFDSDEGLIFALTPATTAMQPPQQPTSETPQEEPSTPQDEPIELVVTGEQDGYRVPNASTATKTDTPLRDIPQSIQVVPQQVLRDRNIRGITEAVETVSGVVEGADSITRFIRGFSTDNVGSASQLRNGYRIGNSQNGLIPEEPTVAIEQVDILKGPGSVLFGALEPGGTINTITKKPLREPFYQLAFEAGNYGFYQPSIDLSGPLTADKTVLYRFIAAYNGTDGYFDGGGKNNTLIAPSISLKLGDRTSLDLFYQYSRFAGDLYGGLQTVALSDGRLAPRGINVWGNPDLTFDDRKSHQYGFELKHNFNANLQLRSAFSANNLIISEQRFAVPIGVMDDRFVDLFYLDRSRLSNIYFGQIDLVGKFNTGSITHQLVVGFDVMDDSQKFESFSSRTPLPPIDLLSPSYGVARPTDLVPGFKFEQLTRSYGVYLQDQIEFSKNWKLLIGGRYDWVSNEFENLVNNTDEPAVKDGAFSPRLGLVYQPSDTVSFYASYSSSFLQTTSFSPDQIFEPTRGTQYEVGIKTDFLDKRLSATLAAYHLTKTNVVTADPNNPFLSIQTGEQRSQGIELDVAGEILPGWRVIASYAYTDAEITKDNTFSVGNRLNNVPYNQASLWTTYQIQQGDLKGLGFGLGLFYIGERQGDLDNSFELDDYLRTDAALYYRRDGFRAGINVRNLFDADYAAFGSGSTNIRRGQPFTITGSISWEF